MKNDLLNALKTADDIELPMDDAFYDRLHDKIMAKVEDTEIKKLPAWTHFVARPKKYLKSHWKGWLGSGLSMAILVYLGSHISASVSSFIPESHAYKVVQNERAFLNNALNSPEYFARTLINHQNHDDLLSDVASRQIELNEEELHRIKAQIN